MKKAIVCLFMILIHFSAFLSGCAEVDESWVYRVQCGCGQSQEALLFEENNIMPEVWTMDTACETLSKNLIGNWIGQGDSSEMKISFSDDGQYQIYERAGRKWLKQRTGTYWVEYELHQDMFRPELHMLLPTGDDYVVRFSMMNNDELHLEEPQDGGSSAMVFLRIEK